MRTHRWLGHNGVENCRAEAMLQPCGECNNSRNNAREESEGGNTNPLNLINKKAAYKFGDLTRAIVKDGQSIVKEIVVKEIVKEQKDLGKFDNLKTKIQAFKIFYGDGSMAISSINRYPVILVVGFSLVTSCFVILCYLQQQYQKLGISYFTIPTKSQLQIATNIGVVQASSNVCSSYFAMFLLFVIGRLIGEKVFLNSSIIHTFCKNFLHIDLHEIELDLRGGAIELRRIADHGMVVCGIGFVVGLGVWFQGLRHSSYS